MATINDNGIAKIIEQITNNKVTKNVERIPAPPSKIDVEIKSLHTIPNNPFQIIVAKITNVNDTTITVEDIKKNIPIQSLNFFKPLVFSICS
jgi:hypothetical protein